MTCEAISFEKIELFFDFMWGGQFWLFRQKGFFRPEFTKINNTTEFGIFELILAPNVWFWLFGPNLHKKGYLR